MNSRNGPILSASLGALLLALTVPAEGEPTAVPLLLLLAAGIGLVVVTEAQRRRSAAAPVERRPDDA